MSDKNRLLENFKLYGSVTVGSKGQIVIPAEAREELDIKQGDRFIVFKDPHGEGLTIISAKKLEAILSAVKSKLGSFAKIVSEIKDLN